MVIITDSVLYSIGAVELMKFQNKIDQNDITVQEKAELEDFKKINAFHGCHHSRT